MTNLGLGKHVTVSTLAEHVALLVHDTRLRAAMRARMLAAVRDRSNRRIVADLMAAAQALRKRKE